MATDVAPGDTFGFSVAVSGARVIVGSPRDDDGTGAAYRYSWNGTSWSEETKILAPVPDLRDSFGIGVDVRGNDIVIGASGDRRRYNRSLGSAFVYREVETTAVLRLGLTASDGADSDLFGFSVALSRASVIVGAPGTDDLAAESGSAYVWALGSSYAWALPETELAASDGAADDELGISIDTHEDLLVAGAAGDDDDKGAVYVCRWNGREWLEEWKFTASDGEPGDRFGEAVSVWRDVVVVGAPGYDSATIDNVGAVYVFRFDGTSWQEEQIVFGYFDHRSEFGQSVSLYGSRFAVGAPNASVDDNLDSEGSVVVYERDCSGLWSPFFLVYEDRDANDRFGCSVSLDADVLVVGASYHDNRKGAAYVYRGPTWALEAKLMPATLAALDTFGSSVAVARDIVAIGSPGHDNAISDNVGCVYAYFLIDAGWSSHLDAVCTYHAVGRGGR